MAAERPSSLSSVSGLAAGVIITTESGDSLHFFEGESTRPACCGCMLASPLAWPDLISVAEGGRVKEPFSVRFDI